MNRFILAAIFTIAFSLPCLAQERIYKTGEFGHFGNLRTRLDPKTKKEVELTDQEVKNIVLAKFNAFFELAQSNRKINPDNVKVSQKEVLVPITEASGAPFFTTTINRDTSLSYYENQLFLKEKSDMNSAQWAENRRQARLQEDKSVEDAKKFMANKPKTEKKTQKLPLKDNTGKKATQQKQQQKKSIKTIGN